MKKTAQITIASLILLLSPMFAQAQITLDDCMRMAKENYPLIKELGLIEEASAYDIANVSKAWVPQVTISGKASYQSEVVEMPFEMPGFSFDMPHDQYSIIGEISQTLWDGGVSMNQKKIIKSTAQVQKKQTEVSLHSLKERVQKIYLGILLSDAQLEQNSILIESLERNMKQAQDCIDNGIAYQSDVDMVKVNILSAQQQRIDIETTRSAYVHMLEKLIGTNLEGQDFVLPQDQIPLVTSPVNRPELALYNARIEQTFAQVKMLNSNISPKFSLAIQGGYGRPGLNMLKNEFQPYWTAGIRMQWNLGALYTKRGDKRKLDTQARRIEAERETFLLNTDLEIKEKNSTIEKINKQLLKDDEIIRLRQSIRAAGEQQYANGTITMGELTKRIDDEYNAMATKAIHQIQLAMAVCTLRNTLGQ